jgi:hypothetical protein
MTDKNIRVSAAGGLTTDRLMGLKTGYLQLSIQRIHETKI